MNWDEIVRQCRIGFAVREGIEKNLALVSLTECHAASLNSISYMNVLV